MLNRPTFGGHINERAVLFGACFLLSFLEGNTEGIVVIGPDRTDGSSEASSSSPISIGLGPNGLFESNPSISPSRTSRASPRSSTRDGHPFVESVLVDLRALRHRHTRQPAAALERGCLDGRNAIGDCHASQMRTFCGHVVPE